MSVRILTTIAAFIIILAIVSIGNFKRVIFLATVLMALAKSVESLSDVFYGFFQQHEKMGIMAKSIIIKGVASVAVLILIFHLSSSLALSLCGLTLAWVLVLIFYDWQRGTKLFKTTENISNFSLLISIIKSIKNRQKVLLRIIALSFPLGVVMGIISFNVNIPRYAVEKFLGAHDLGIFAALAYTSIAINLFIQALGQAASPRLARHFADKNIKGFIILLKKMILTSLMINLSVILIIIFKGEEILSIVYTKEYGAYSGLFIILMVATTLSGIAIALSYAMTAVRQFNLQVPLFLMVMVSTWLASYLMVPYYGLYGAAFALIISALAQTIGSILVLRRELKKNKLKCDFKDTLMSYSLEVME